MLLPPQILHPQYNMSAWHRVAKKAYKVWSRELRETEKWLQADELCTMVELCIRLHRSTKEKGTVLSNSVLNEEPHKITSWILKDEEFAGRQKGLIQQVAWRWEILSWNCKEWKGVLGDRVRRDTFIPSFFLMDISCAPTKGHALR